MAKLRAAHKKVTQQLEQEEQRNRKYMDTLQHEVRGDARGRGRGEDVAQVTTMRRECAKNQARIKELEKRNEELVTRLQRLQRHASKREEGGPEPDNESVVSAQTHRSKGRSSARGVEPPETDADGGWWSAWIQSLGSLQSDPGDSAVQSMYQWMMEKMLSWTEKCLSAYVSVSLARLVTQRTLTGTRRSSCKNNRRHWQERRRRWNKN